MHPVPLRARWHCTQLARTRWRPRPMTAVSIVGQCTALVLFIARPGIHFTSRTGARTENRMPEEMRRMSGATTNQGPATALAASAVPLSCAGNCSLGWTPRAAAHCPGPARRHITSDAAHRAATSGRRLHMGLQALSEAKLSLGGDSTRRASGLARCRCCILRTRHFRPQILNSTNGHGQRRPTSPVGAPTVHTAAPRWRSTQCPAIPDGASCDVGMPCVGRWWCCCRLWSQVLALLTDIRADSQSTCAPHATRPLWSLLLPSLLLRRESGSRSRNCHILHSATCAVLLFVGNIGEN
jgi:hypothetical protein